MTDEALPPPGWYPDPSGEPQWRAWNGQGWSQLTRPYAPTPGNFLERLPSVRATETLRRWGIAAYFGGLGAMADLWHHHHEFSSNTLQIAAITAFVLASFGHFAYAHAVVSASPNSLLVSEIPFVNTIVWADRAPGGLGQRSSTNGFTQLLVLVALGLYAFLPLPSSVVPSIAVHVLPAAGAAINLYWATMIQESNGA